MRGSGSRIILNPNKGGDRGSGRGDMTETVIHASCFLVWLCVRDLPVWNYTHRVSNLQVAV